MFHPSQKIGMPGLCSAGERNHRLLVQDESLEEIAVDPEAG